jgi:lysyl endopeptidase
MKKIKLSILLIIICLCANAQVNIGGEPYAFNNDIIAEKIQKNEKSRIALPKIEFERLLKEDNINEALGKPFRYGKSIKAAYDLNNSGEWIYLENGDRIWRLAIYCPLAKSINLSYDKFWLPEGATLYLYDRNKTSYIGGFNKRNNKGTNINPAGFATGLIFSEEIILEYYEPKQVKNEGVISISRIVYGYKDIGEEFGTYSISDCTVNINCSPEGDDWQIEKTSVAVVLMNGVGCTGSLVNNTRENGTPYFLTADHCINHPDVNLDAYFNPDASFFIFWWNYESPGCSDVPHFPPPSTVGASVVANNSQSDFALLKLMETPFDLSPAIGPWFNGWDRREIFMGPTVGIHHPGGQMKKIAIDGYYNSPLCEGNKWRVQWHVLENGVSVLFPGSSGSPLYNNDHRVIGQAWSVNQLPPPCKGQTAAYGKFSVSWNEGSSQRRRLKHWLDPDGSDVDLLNGTHCTTIEFISNISFVSDTTIYGCQIIMHDVTVGHGANVIFRSFGDVTINDEFMVELGSAIEIR